MPKKHIFLQNGSTLGDISLQNVIAHPAEFLCFFDVQQQNLELTKNLKKTNSMVLYNALAPQNSY